MSTLTRSQRRNLAKLADYLESLPKRYRHFDMFDFIAPKDLGDEAALLKYAKHNGGVPSCGTVACAVGHGPAAGVLFRDDEITGGDPNWRKYAERFLPAQGGPWDFTPAFEWAFSGNWRDVDSHHWGAAARIRYLLKNGKPPADFNWPARKFRKLYREFDKRYAERVTA